MTRYYFDTSIGNVSIDDPEGVEMTSLDAVEKEVTLALADMAREAARHSPASRVAVSVRDERGLIMSACLEHKVVFFK
jgi:hypothetical protein